MTTAGWGVLAAALLVMAAAVALAVARVRAAERRYRAQVARLSDWVDRAATGRLGPPSFDDTVESSLDARLRTLLAGAEVARAQVGAERDAVRELVGSVAHQTKTPLTTILLHTELAAEQPLPDEARRLLGTVAEQTRHLDDLVSTLVTAAALESGAVQVAPVPCPVADLLAGAVHRVAVPAEQRDVAIEVAATDGVVLADRTWGREVLANLLDNAVKYSPPGSTVRVAVTAAEVFCRIDVVDHGIGIAEAETASVFARFYRSPAVADRPGLGIGLSLVRQVVHLHGGFVRVRSRLGEGSTFSVFWPRSG